MPSNSKQLSSDYSVLLAMCNTYKRNSPATRTVFSTRFWVLRLMPSLCDEHTIVLGPQPHGHWWLRWECLNSFAINSDRANGLFFLDSPNGQCLTVLFCCCSIVPWSSTQLPSMISWRLEGHVKGILFVRWRKCSTQTLRCVFRHS